MVQFNFNDKVYNLTTSWNEITLGQFIKVNKIQQTNALIKLSEETLAQQLLEALTNSEVGEFDEMLYKQLTSLTPYIIELQNGAAEFNNQKFITGVDHWVIDGVLYSYKSDPNDLNAGEVSDLKHYIANKTNEWDYLADIATVLIRPATESLTPSGMKWYKLSKRNTNSHNYDKRIVMNMWLGDITRVIGFFFVGLKTLMNDTSDYSGVIHNQ